MTKLESKRQADALSRLNKMPRTFAVKVDASHNGFPDVVCACNGTTYYFEFKQPGKKPTPLQAATHRKLRRTGHVAEKVTCYQECVNIINENGGFDLNVVTDKKG